MWTEPNQALARRASDAPLQPCPVMAREPAIDRALAHDGIDVLFQPQFELAHGRLVGVEALARIAGIDDGEALFTRAGRAGLAERLSRQVQRNVLSAAARWDGALANLPVAINVLAQDIARDGFVDWLLNEIAAAGIDPARVTVELTEQALIADLPQIAARLGRLREAGLGVALDDFGTGYANLGNVASLPLDRLKVDRSLIAKIEACQRARAVARTVLKLARELDLKVIVEGVESAGQLALLHEWGCDCYQGFLGGRPMTEAQLAAFAAVRR